MQIEPKFAPASLPAASPLLGGHAPGGGVDAAVAAHYGDPVAEQWALQVGAALTDLSHFGVVRVSGPDRLSLLTTLGSQVVTDIGASSRELLMLDASGHIAFSAGVIDRDQVAYLITDAGRAAELADYILRMRFLSRLEVEVAGDLAPVGFTLGGPLQRALAGELVWEDPWPGVCEGGASYGPAVEGAPRFAIWLAPRQKLQNAVGAALQKANTGFPLETELGYEVKEPALAGIAAWEALRIQAHRPRYGREVDARSLPHELDWLRTAVHLHKGCYCGQESVARIVNLGKPPRRLAFVSLDGSTDDLPRVGTEIKADGKKVGSLTSVARHCEDGPIGLAVVKRGAKSGRVDVGGVAGLVSEIVNSEGKADVSPTERPGAGLRGSVAGLTGGQKAGLGLA
ncbi:folate-binding protein YgfZ [Winkia neuii]|uniref:Folate-binding protein YgfZ n=2 Tax=Winkia neuii TaxID=33007 RepID=A0A2I1IR02_9ACTO|nr:folate-binding protein YgfZ [Winkia neuii]PKY73540.1 folate-binding protein YgfZ [Winkia neuii]